MTTPIGDQNQPYNGYTKEHLQTLIKQMEFLETAPEGIVKSLNVEFTHKAKGTIRIVDDVLYFVPDNIQPSQHNYFER